jgi:glycosyltransferase involved in cell wall biosynthesis
MINNTLKFSIITVCLNSEKTLKSTIKSVLGQTYENIEYILVDGGSEDSTLDIINEYKNDITKYISEKDDGIYDAMNKGIGLSTGDIIYFLNSGDILYDKDVIKTISDIFFSHQDCEIVTGNAVLYYDEYEQAYSSRRKNVAEYIITGICHQTIFAKRTIFKKTGLFNTNYRVYADLDWVLNCVIDKKICIHYANLNMCYYLMGGFNNINSKRYKKERFSIKNKYITKYTITDEILASPRTAAILVLIKIYLNIYNLLSKI